MSQPYTIVIGLEVHVQLLTESKMFCACSTKFGAAPNTQTCPVCIGMPGSLPVMNRRAVELALRTAVALNCQIARFTKWDRKNYYYPDLPKGYQISQFDLPLSHDGWLPISDPKGRVEPKRVGIIRAHLEEDAGKSMHDELEGKADSRIDLNRCGVPLLEIVSQPDMRSPAEARAYLTELKLLLNYLEVSDCNMQEGSLRVDANINLHVHAPQGKVATPIVEVKNMNSFRAVERAMVYEEQRQYQVWQETGRKMGDVPKQTRGWDDEAQVTRGQRSKEESSDYRYFPEPDLLPVAPSPDWVEELRAALPELPAARRARLQAEWELPDLDMAALRHAGAIDLVEQTVAAGAAPADARKWWLGELLRRANESGVELAALPVTPAQVARVAELVATGALNDKLARQALDGMLAGEGDPDQVVAARSLAVVSDDGELLSAVDAAIAANPDVVAKIRSGKTAAAGVLVGAVMKATRGQADATRARELIMERLG
ncbi:MAG: Asp-tRNA(Asn)/Glu-tRNA(Gln) amidotransferase subunit GatB [Streptosporangiaceae bacterium]